MSNILIKNVQIVNEGKITVSDILIGNQRILKIEQGIDNKYNAREINGENKYLLPGVIDDQVHFREPGLTHKANIHSESIAAVAGGTTSFMEMPNTQTPCTDPGIARGKIFHCFQQCRCQLFFFHGHFQ